VSETETSAGSADEDWRLEADLDVADTHRRLGALVGRVREPSIVREVQAEVPHDVVITHDGKLLFAYAADAATIGQARDAIESALRRDGIDASIRLSMWDEERDEWRQTDPPASESERRAQEVADRDAEAIETRTAVASAGKLIRAEFEQTMVDWADKLGLECTAIEHPHLLTTQVGFTVTGPRRKIEEFMRALNETEHTTIRTESVVMLSPL
jgi:hypothetical protein